MISIMLHAYNAFAVFDYAGVGSYIQIDMNTPPLPIDKLQNEALSSITTSNLSLSKRIQTLKMSGFTSRQIYSILKSTNDSISAHYDALVLSPHKLIGGPGTPGILAIRNTTLQKLAGPDYIPSQVGGGIVEFVTTKTQTLITHPEHREETGTPAIIESIRAGLSFTVKQMVGSEVIAELEQEHITLIREKLELCPDIVVLGGLDHDHHAKVPVLSFLIRKGAKYLHYNYVAALLNDFFGIQARAGCACAGPYGVKLLQVSQEKVEAYQQVCTSRSCCMGKKSGWRTQLNAFKPGFTRLSFNYFTRREDVEFVLDAMIWISRNAEKVMAAYDYSLETGNWYFAKSVKEDSTAPALSSMVIGRFGPWHLPTAAPPSKAECFQLADEFVTLMQQEKCVPKCKDLTKERIGQDRKLNSLKWFYDGGNPKIYPEYEL